MASSVTRQRVANVSLLEYASDNRNEGFFSDVTINSGKQTIAANRLVLSCYSRYFEGMFKSKMKERYESVIEIQAVDGQTTKALIDFIYIGFITINNENVMLLLSGADYFQMQEVKQFCFEFLRSHVTSDNALNILKAATMYKNDPLKDEVEQYIGDNFEDVARTEDFKDLSKQSLTARISSLDSNTVNVALIYQAIMSWTRHDEETRKLEFPELFKLLDLTEVSIDFMENFVLEYDLINSNFQCQKLAMRAYRKLLEKTKLHATKLLSLGGRNTGKKTAVVYDLLNETFAEYPDLPEEIEAHCSLKFKDYVYCVGGTEPTKDIASSNVYRSTLKQNSAWEQVSSMNEARHVMGAAVYFDAIFVVGGADEQRNQLASSEYYQVALNKWKTIAAPLNQKRSGHAVVSAGGYLYALGGFNKDDKHLSSVERLSDLSATSWKNIKPMQTPRKWFAAVNCDGEIYAFGGQNGNEDTTRLKTVEKYDSAANQWKYVSDMNIERAAHAACVLQGKIYAVGGLNKKGELVKEIECYNPGNDTWATVGNTTDKLYCHSLIPF